jgi:type III pantothenate kinase
MNLVIDIGNTRSKAALFDEDHLLEHFYFDKNPQNQVKKLLTEHPEIRFSIVSSVVNHSKETVNLLQHKSNCVEFNSNTLLPVSVEYDSPETLGRDRIAAAVGAFKLFKGKNVLSIDAGTCIKFDFVTKEGVYKGGSISPGIGMRFNALNAFTDKLPLVAADMDFKTLIGQSTQGSIQSGVQNGAIFEVKGFVDVYSTQYPGLNIVLSGGDSSFFEGSLKNSIFVSPNLVLIGLNEILNFNVSQKI